MRQTATILVALCAFAPLAAADKPPARPANIAIVVYEGMEILDFAGPAEVLKMAASFGGDGIAPAWNVYTVARTREPVLSQGFIRIVPQYSVADAAAPDIVVIPGGRSDALSDDEAMMKWLRRATGAADVTLTVCTGAFPLAQSGLLDGKDVTTFYGAIDSLRKLAPRARVIEGRRFIDSGKVITTAGVSAGIDGSLHLVARLLGRQVADRTARYMEYRWTPESYLATRYRYWNPSTDDRGRTLQQAEAAADEKRWAEATRLLRKLVAQRPRDDVAWLHLGYTLSSKGDRSQAIAAYQRVSSSGPHRGDAQYYIAREHAARGDKTRATQHLTRALSAGFDRHRASMDPLLAPLLASAPR
jgi:putative intracellular protease/amidase